CIAAGAAARTPAECFGRIDALAAFERDTLAASNAALAAGLAEGRRKGVADRNIADLAARERRAASESMEAANARIGTDDHVGGDWFAALNRAAGLRAPR
uniref:hypothetical protein n=1 Tax=Sphingomonas sp. TaxID=28214 RepID=UPI003B3AF9FA